MRRHANAALVFFAGLVTAPQALAFCRTSICELGDVGTRCTPARDGDCGVPLFWRERCVGFSVASEGSRYFSSELTAELVSRVFETWQSADCNGSRPQIFVKRQPDALCARPEYNVDRNVDKGNANVVMFRDDDWPYPQLEDGLALTTLTYDVTTGEIYDADIEINTFGFEFSTSDDDVTYDLASTLQHETGHFLGLAHSPEIDSPMYELPEYGTTRRRTLLDDDIAAVCDMYPPEGPAIDADCSPMPHDFSPECDATLPGNSPPESGAGCSASAAPPRAGAPAAMIATASLLLLGCLRRGRSGAIWAHSQG